MPVSALRGSLEALDDQRRLDEFDNTVSDEHYVGGFIIAFMFFLIWNALLCWPIIGAVATVIRQGFNDHAVVADTSILLCPHWLVGLIVPAAIGYYTYGVSGLFLGFVPFAVPYCIGAILKCTRCRGLRGQPNRGVAPSENERQEIKGGFSHLSGTERREYLTKTVLVTKVVTEETLSVQRQSRESNHELKDKQSDNATPEGNERETSPEVGESDNFENDTVMPGGNGPETSSEVGKSDNFENECGAQLCSICLDEYACGEEVAYSRNPSCHHMFHTQCIVEWLMKHSECPVCRGTFDGFIEEDPEAVQIDD